ncbi:hypothetical protein [Skermanella aerolata]|nr:hypothetical protein [Skermanella aerolata]
MTEVLGALSKAEDRDASAVLFDLTLAPFDVIRVRSKDADDYGSIRFDAGLQLHEEAKRLVVSAALAEASEVPRRAWKGRRPDSVSQYLERIRLGQTENASFSLTVLSPYSFDPAEQASLFQDNAFGRRVTLKFGAALAAIQDALAESVADPLPAFESIVDVGVSADMCQALAKLADSDAGVDVSISWSPAKPVQEPIHLGLTRQDAAVLQEVAHSFSRREPEPDFVIEGLVEEIKEKPERFDGSVVIQAPLPNQLGVRKIRVRFDQRYRDIVYDAARNKKWVRVIGDLGRDGKSLTLFDPRDFSIVEPDDQD